MDAVALGELLVDFSCREKNDSGYPVMDGRPGGAPANWLSALSRFGCRTAFIAKVGDDSFGRMLENTLREYGISEEGLVRDSSVFTTLAFVTFDDRNNREFSFARKPGADMMLREDEVNLSLIERSKILHFGSLSLTDEPARSATRKAVLFARERGKTVSFDPNFRRPLWKDPEEAKREILWGIDNSDILKISDDEVRFVFGSDDFRTAAEDIVRHHGVSLVMVTMGEKGSIYATENAAGFVPALGNLDVTDTTGAGDIYGASAVYALLESGKSIGELTPGDLDRIVSFASVSAGLSTERKGGISSVPEKEQVLRRMHDLSPVCRFSHSVSSKTAVTPADTAISDM